MTTSTIPRADAIVRFFHLWDAFQHIGDVPSEEEIQGVINEDMEGKRKEEMGSATDDELRPEYQNLVSRKTTLKPLDRRPGIEEVLKNESIDMQLALEQKGSKLSTSMLKLDGASNIDQDVASDPGDCPSPVRPPPVCIWDIKATVPKVDPIKVAGVTRRKLIKWLIDTGCGHDLLSEAMRRQL
ncbi:MAG: hypothetical protein GY768_14275, partial [Planctomycetaceae bacterium]|nr:hypothetical protein [Planctomycetaceae bacterium]